jgi:hypothetical protein
MIRYRIDDLGWFQFEWLCQSLLKVSLGLGVEAWGGSSDLGRDAYSSGTLPLDGPKSQTAGPFIFQAKFVTEANAAGARPDANLRDAVYVMDAAPTRAHQRLRPGRDPNVVGGQASARLPDGGTGMKRAKSGPW